MGFGSELTRKQENNVGELLRRVLPEVLMKYGLIPEFIGRVPVVVSLDALDRDALIRILKEPRNAIIKQYQKLFELDGVELAFTQDAVEAVADQTLARKTGARGLRAILEKAMRDLMFEIPSNEDIIRCVVDKDTILGTGRPQLTYRKGSFSDKRRKAGESVDTPA